MNRITVTTLRLMILLFSFVLIASPSTYAQRGEFITLEQIALFPERYNGQTLFIEDVSLREVSRCGGQFCLIAYSPGGKYFGSALLTNGFALTVTPEMADLLLEAKNRLGFSAINWDREPGRIGFRVVKVQEGRDSYWVGQVFEVAMVALADARVISSDKKASVLLAAARGDSHTISSVVKDRSLANVSDENGKTALMYATEGGHEKTVKKLLSLGADIDARMKDGKTARDFAQASSKSSIVKLLSPRSEHK